MTTKYTKDVLQEAVAASTSVAGVLRYLGLRQAGGTQAYLAKKIKDFDIDTPHFAGKGRKGLSRPNERKTADQVLIVRKPGSHREKAYLLRRAMVESGIKYKCSECPVESEWNGLCISLEVDHVDGDNLNNSLGNLRFLCPNCHSQQETANRPHKYS